MSKWSCACLTSLTTSPLRLIRREWEVSDWDHAEQFQVAIALSYLLVSWPASLFLLSLAAAAAARFLSQTQKPRRVSKRHLPGCLPACLGNKVCKIEIPYGEPPDLCAKSDLRPT